MAEIYTGTHGTGALCPVVGNDETIQRVTGESTYVIHTANVYNALFTAAAAMEKRLSQSLKTYEEHPDVQANLQQLQYDLAQWNLALTTMTNINKTMADGLSAIAGNFR